jgi:HD-like signal output (HDOD) protein
MTRPDELAQREPGLARIIDTLEQIGSLPTIPLAAQHAMTLARDERSSMRQIAEVISQDQALAARVLKTVNSAFYGLRQSVGTLPLALTILGVREIMNLVLSISILSAFPESPDRELFSQRALWRASARCAHAAKELAHAVGLGRLASEAFLSALVHDIGLIVLDQHFRDEFTAVLRGVQRDGLDPLVAETKILGTTHASIGAWLAERWLFPKPLVEAIAYHHCPSESSWEPPLPALVYLSELILTLHEKGVTLEEAAAAYETDKVWVQLISLGPPVRSPAPAKLLEDVCNRIEAAPLIINEPTPQAR